MTDEKGYLEKMRFGYTESEKLFFLRYLDVADYDAIIDFGCADGKLLSYVVEHITNPNTLIIGIEKNENFRLKAENYCRCLKEEGDWCGKTYFVDNLTEASKLLAPDHKVLIIFSSVLHEIDEECFHNIHTFISKWVNTVVIRDMFWSNAESVDLNRLFDVYDHFSRKQIKMFQQIGGGAIKRSFIRQMYEFFLKYTYIENWETESREDYFANRAFALANILVASKTSSWKALYQEHYVLPYKRDQVMKDFGYCMIYPTHCKYILVKENEK